MICASSSSTITTPTIKTRMITETTNQILRLFIIICFQRQATKKKSVAGLSGPKGGESLDQMSNNHLMQNDHSLYEISTPGKMSIDKQNNLSLYIEPPKNLRDIIRQICSGTPTCETYSSIIIFMLSKSKVTMLPLKKLCESSP